MLFTEPPEPQAEQAEADGIVTTLEDYAAVVVTADCLPVALIAPEGVAMIHAGWRGLAADALKKGVEKLREAGATDIQAAIGPSIGVCCYEVNTWVHRSFMRYPRGTARLSNHAHLKNVARLQLQHAKLPLDMVHDVDICTMCAPRSLFHSHRRDYGGDPKDTGRQASAAWRVPVEPGDGLTEPIDGLTAERVRANLAEVQERIAAAAARAGRDASDVEIVAAVKYVPVTQLGMLAEGGVTVAGENRAQDLAAKVAAHGDAFSVGLHRPRAEPQGQADRPARAPHPLGLHGLRARAAAQARHRPSCACSSRSTSPARRARTAWRPPSSTPFSSAARSPSPGS